jgi:hypothetical protein
MDLCRGYARRKKQHPGAEQQEKHKLGDADSPHSVAAVCSSSCFLLPPSLSKVVVGNNNEKEERNAAAASAFTASHPSGQRTVGPSVNKSAVPPLG